jgi:hypothetical protein
VMVAELIGAPVRAKVWRAGSELEIQVVPEELTESTS